MKNLFSANSFLRAILVVVVGGLIVYAITTFICIEKPNPTDYQHLKKQKIETDKSHWSFLGLVVHETEKTSIITDYQDGIAQSSNPDVERMFAEGREHYLKKEYPQAISLYERCLEIESDYEKRGALHLQIGIFYYLFGKHEESVDSYTTALVEANRANDEECVAAANNNRGLAYVKMKRFDKALEDYTKAIDLNPEYADAYYNRGIAYADSGMHKEALEDYTKAIDLNPKLAQAHYNRGNAYYRMKCFIKALEDYTKALEINPDFILAYLNRGNTYVKMKRFDKAIEDYTKVINLNPEFADAYKNRGIAYELAGNHEKSQEDFKKEEELRLKSVK